MIGFFSISWCGHLLRNVAPIGTTAYPSVLTNPMEVTFLGGLNPETASIYLTDLAHHHVAVGILFVWSGHIYSSFFKGFAHRLRDILFVNGNSSEGVDQRRETCRRGVD